MRKQDIKPGVVYAYQERKHLPIRPVVFMAASPYEIRRRGESGPTFHPASQGARVGRAYGPTCGYPAVRPASACHPREPDWAPVAERMVKFTLTDFTAADAGRIDDCIEFGLIDRLASVLGPWGEVIAARKAREQAEREGAERDRQQQQAQDARATAALAALGVLARWDSYSEHVIMSLGSAEKLARLLSKPEAGES